jgi:hypothetical protein
MKKLQNSAKRLATLFFISSLVLATSCKENTTETKTDAPIEKSANEVKASTPATNDSLAKNPAHGQPNHRCDIPVGAPLNSASTKVNTDTQSSPLINNTSGGTGKLNPAHGQPGHQCGIPVGSPL